MKIEMHLFDDYKATAINCLRHLVARGLRVRGFPNGEMPSDDWFNANGLSYLSEYCHRRIVPRPRKVCECSSFSCPEDLNHEYLKIVDEITKGADLSNRQTYYIDKIGCTDSLLNEWGLHHLHFSKRNGDKWEVNEDRLLYVYVTDETVYVVRVGRHDDFENIDLVAELNKDYPNLFPHLRGAEKTNRRTNESVKEFRGANINVIDVLDDGALAGLGGGMGLNGTSLSAYAEICHDRRRLDCAEKVIADKFRDMAKQQFPNRPDIYNRTSICLKLTYMDEDKVVLKCEELRLKVGLRDKGQEMRLRMVLY